MRIRHKVPSIFSLSMVDVLCCALGCVILVWLLNAKQSEDEADERDKELAALRLQAEADKTESGKLLAASRTEYSLLALGSSNYSTNARRPPPPPWRWRRASATSRPCACRSRRAAISPAPTPTTSPAR